MRDGHLFVPDFTLTLTADEHDALMRPIAPGDWGGHQYLEHEFQQRVRGRTLVVNGEELDRAYGYAYDYGNGTWQAYMRAVVTAGLRAGWKPV